LTQASLDRRSFIATLAVGLLAAPLVAEGQPAEKVWRIGYLSPAVDHNNPILDNDPDKDHRETSRFLCSESEAKGPRSGPMFFSFI